MKSMEGEPIVIQGFEIPSDSPLFLSILSVHVLAGLVCVVAGIVAMLSKKQRGTHSRAGSVYYWVLWIVFGTSIMIAVFRWKEDYHLFILGCLSFLSAVAGKIALKRKWPKWSIIHISGMGVSYIFLLTAFYVDNGRFLPVWKNFDPIVFWLLPSLIGVPIIVRTLVRHPLSSMYFRRN